VGRSRYQFLEQNCPHFLTSTVAAWIPIFAHPWAVDIVLESWRFLQRERGVRLFGYVVLENHLHWLAAAEQLAARVREFKSYTARRIIDELLARRKREWLADLRRGKQRHKNKQVFQLWQEGSHPQQIQGEAMMVQKLDYIHSNPVRRGYVDDPAHWRYSSARNYAGEPGLIEVDMDW
jgi:REP element-mobilizing transposase RayT